MAAAPQTLPPAAPMRDGLPDDHAQLLATLVELVDRGGPVTSLEVAAAAGVDKRSTATKLLALERRGLIISRAQPSSRIHGRKLVYEPTAHAIALTARRAAGAPVVYLTVANARIAHVEDRIRAQLGTALARFQATTTDWIAAELQQVYADGIADGFGQGVAAEAARHPEVDGRG